MHHLVELTRSNGYCNSICTTHNQLRGTYTLQQFSTFPCSWLIAQNYGWEKIWLIWQIKYNHQYFASIKSLDLVINKIMSR